MGFGNKNGAGPEAAAPTGAPPKFVWPPQRQDVKQPAAVAAPAVDNTPPISPTKASLPPISDMEDARVTSAAPIQEPPAPARTLQDMINEARANVAATAAATADMRDRAMGQPHHEHAPEPEAPAESKLTNPSLPPEPAPAVAKSTRTRRVSTAPTPDPTPVAGSASLATVLGGRLAEANPAPAAPAAPAAPLRTATASTDPILAQLHEQLRSAQVHAQNMVARGIEEHDNAVQEAQAIAAARLQNVKTAAAEITASAQAMIDRVAAALSGVPLMDSLAATPARGRPAKASKPEKKASKSAKKASKKVAGPTKGRPVPTAGLGALICSRLAQNWAPEKIAEEGAKKFPDKKCDTRIVSWYKSQIKSGRLVYPK
jgi:hypothetical protein